MPLRRALAASVIKAGQLDELLKLRFPKAALNDAVIHEILVKLFPADDALTAGK